MRLREMEAPAFLVRKKGLDGMITNDKFCCTRWSQLQLSWWRRPLRLRQAAEPADLSELRCLTSADVGGGPHYPGYLHSIKTTPTGRLDRNISAVLARQADHRSDPHTALSSCVSPFIDAGGTYEDTLAGAPHDGCTA
jgi:hypothetical protein